VEVIESADMAVDPVGQMLAQRGVRKGVSTGDEHRYEKLCRHHVAGLVVVNRNRRTGPVDEHLLACLVILPERDILIPPPVRAVLYAVHDVTQNAGWVSVRTDHGTAAGGGIDGRKGLSGRRQAADNG
jgi:hypothetical protein